MCRFMCIYKVWQHTFKTKETLHVAYDSERSDQCAKCNYCVTSCFLDIDPRQTDVYDACTNCGECITACNNLQAKKNGAPGLLRFAIGERNRDNIANSRTGLAGLKGRLAWTLPFMALGMFLFVWGLATYETYHFTVYKSDVDQGTQIDDYTINIAHKKYHPGEVSITLEGLDSEVYSLSRSTVKFDSTGRQDVQLNVKSDQLEPGLVPFIVRIESGDGWVDHFRVHHFVGKQHS
jgi:polyferredoxin